MRTANRPTTGVLLSWDRTMSEISDKLWLAVDYQSGKSSLGALNFGVSWAFSKNVSVIFGYDIYNKTKTGGNNTFTTQVDINFPCRTSFIVYGGDQAPPPFSLTQFEINFEGSMTPLSEPNRKEYNVKSLFKKYATVLCAVGFGARRCHRGNV